MPVVIFSGEKGERTIFKQRWLAVLVIACFCIQMLAFAPAAALADDDASGVPAVNTAQQEAQPEDHPDFIPDQLQVDEQTHMTREQYCEVTVNLYVYLKGEIGAAPAEIQLPADADTKFSDTTNPFVLKAFTLGIVSAPADGLFHPQDKLTVQEEAVMLYNTLKAVDPSISQEPPIQMNFEDANEVDDWADKAVSYLHSIGVVTPDSNNEVNPTEPVTRDDSHETTTDAADTFIQLQNDLEYDFIPDRLLTDDQKHITREEFCEVSVRLYVYMKQQADAAAKPIQLPAVNPFEDTANPYVLKAFSLGIVSAPADGLFRPQDKLTIQEKAVILYNTMKLLDPAIETDVPDDYAFADENQISPWASKAIAYLSENNIIQPDVNNRINPKGNKTRAAAVDLMSAVISETEKKYALYLFGYDVLHNTYVSRDKITSNPILDRQKVNDAVADSSIDVSTDDSTVTETLDYTEHAASAIFKQMNRKASFSYKGAMFSGDIEGEYGEKSEMKSETWLNKHMVYFAKHEVSIDYMLTDPSALLAPAFLRDVRKYAADPAKPDQIDKIFTLYGTHLIKHYYLGGRMMMNVNLTSSSQSEETKKDISIGVSYSSLTDEQAKARLDQHQQECRSLVTSTGGIVFRAAGGKPITGNNWPDFQSKYDGWLASVDGTNEDLCGIPQNYEEALIPIWELLEPVEPTLAKNLEDRFISLAGTQQFYLDNYVPEVAPPTPRAESVITDIMILTAKNREDIKYDTKLYTPVYKWGTGANPTIDDIANFNQGTSGPPVWIVYKKGQVTDPNAKDIKKLTVVSPDFDPFNPKATLPPVLRTCTFITGDLNQGTSLRRIYLYWGNTKMVPAGGIKFTEVPITAPGITQICGIVRDASNPPVPAGWEQPEGAMDLNKDAGGKFIYLIFKRAPAPPSPTN